MKKFVMILAALALVGAAVIAWGNKQSIDAVVAERQDFESKVGAATTAVKGLEEKKAEVDTQVAQATDARNKASSEIGGVESKLRNAESALQKVNEEFKQIEIEKKELDLAISRQFPDGSIQSSADLEAAIGMLKEALNAKQVEKTELTASLNTAAQARQVQISKVKEEEQYQVNRAQQVALGGITATVIAANKEWGFVMVNAGRQHGIQPDSALLVRRGNNRIARLRIVNLDESTTTANVVEESLSAGLEVQPGDKVILENP